MLVRPRFSLRFGGAVMNFNNPLQLKQLGVALICIGVAVAALPGFGSWGRKGGAGGREVTGGVSGSGVGVPGKAAAIRRAKASRANTSPPPSATNTWPMAEPIA